MRIAGLKPKDLLGIPWLVAFALRADGWYLRSEIIWAKPNPMPESVTDRPTKAHEQLSAFGLAPFTDITLEGPSTCHGITSRPEFRSAPRRRSISWTLALGLRRVKAESP